MVVGTLTYEIVSPLPPFRLWKAMTKDNHNLLPKALPKLITSVDILQGDGTSVGTIKQFNFTSANKHFSYVKDRVDEVDDDNFVYKYTTIEGGRVGTMVSTIKCEIKFEGMTEGGTKSTFTSEFDTLSDSLPPDAEVEEAKAASATMFKAVEAYLVANPTLYV
eukprot:Gb_32854 [translate_table: standard]